MPSNDFFNVGTTAVFVNGQTNAPKTIFNASGGTLYYKNASDVSSTSNDGNLTAGNSLTATGPEWIVSTTSVNVIVSDAETSDAQYESSLSLSSTLAVTGATTLTGAATLTGGIAQATAPHGFANWQPIAATSGTDTAFANGTQFVTSLFIPVNKTLTGAAYLIGSVGGTDKVYAVLYNASGTNLANSSLTTGGATVGTAANVQTLDFTSTYAAKGPALYYVGISANGATAKLRTVPAHTQAGIFAGSVSQTHGTVAAITQPTTFTADKAPAAYVY